MRRGRNVLSVSKSIVAIAFIGTQCACADTTDAPCASASCGTGDAADDANRLGDAGSDGNLPVPAGCDPAADPKDAPKCVVSDYGIFVDATTGSDNNTGSKELPVKTITSALTKLNGRPRIYVCEGTYPESVKLTSAVSIFGGFACNTWEYNGNKPSIAPNAGVAAIEIVGGSSPMRIADLAFAGPPA